MYKKKEEKLSGFTQAPAAHEKVCNEIESRRKNNVGIKMLLMGGGEEFIRSLYRKVTSSISTSFR